MCPVSTRRNKRLRRRPHRAGVRLDGKELSAQLPLRSLCGCRAGFTDGEGVGTYGLEKSYQSTLAGVDGRTITRRNAVGNAIADQNATTFAAKDGSNLVLSLDVNVQEIVEAT